MDQKDGGWYILNRAGNPKWKSQYTECLSYFDYGRADFVPRIGSLTFSVLAALGTPMIVFPNTPTYYPVNFSSQANFTWLAPQTDPSGQTGTYLAGGPSGSVVLGGIPFNILSNAAGFQAWNAWTAAGGGNQTVSITMPVGVFGVTDVYTLINTYWGTSGSYAALVFTGSAGATYTYNLVGNSDIRGWCCGGTINGTSTINVYTEPSSPINGQTGYLDMQHIVLPALFATQTLVSIQLIDTGATNLQRTVLDGVTVAVIPPPPSPVYSAVNFSSQANFTWLAPQTDPIGLTGTYFPGGPNGSVVLGGVPFNILSNAAGFQAWNAWTAAGGGNQTVSITMPVGVFGVTDVYTLINTYWGTSGSYAALVFTGSAGATYTYNLVGNSDIRNWCCFGAINGTSTINVFTVASSPINGQTGYLDMQHIVLPALFATQTLVSIQLVDTGATNFQRTILDGVTVASPPSNHYNVCLLYDATKAVKSGSTIPIKLQLCGSSGNNLSSPSVTLHATGVIQISTSISGPVQDPGNANPDNDFRFDATLGGTGGYIFNLQTKGMATGTYRLNFTVAGGSIPYAAPFEVK